MSDENLSPLPSPYLRSRAGTRLGAEGDSVSWETSRRRDLGREDALARPGQSLAVNGALPLLPRAGPTPAPPAALPPLPRARLRRGRTTGPHLPAPGPCTLVRPTAASPHEGAGPGRSAALPAAPPIGQHCRTPVECAPAPRFPALRSRSDGAPPGHRPTAHRLVSPLLAPVPRGLGPSGGRSAAPVRPACEDTGNMRHTQTVACRLPAPTYQAGGQVRADTERLTRRPSRGGGTACAAPLKAAVMSRPRRRAPPGAQQESRSQPPGRRGRGRAGPANEWPPRCGGHAPPASRRRRRLAPPGPLHERAARPGPRMREGLALPGGPGAAPVPGFLAKLWALVEDPQSDDVICWGRVRAVCGAVARLGTAACGAGSRGWP